MHHLPPHQLWWDEDLKLDGDLHWQKPLPWIRLDITTVKHYYKPGKTNIDWDMVDRPHSFQIEETFSLLIDVWTWPQGSLSPIQSQGFCLPGCIILQTLVTQLRDFYKWTSLSPDVLPLQPVTFVSIPSMNLSLILISFFSPRILSPMSHLA